MSSRGRNNSHGQPPLNQRLASHAWLILAAILLMVAIAYLPGLHGPFVLDDDENITLNQSIAIERLDTKSLRHAASANESGLAGRPLASLTFALNHYFAGGFGDSFPFKVTNLAIHLVNTVLLYIFVIQLSHSPGLKNRLSAHQKRVLPLLAAALWALHPIQLTNVLYVVQRMNSLSTMFVLSGLIIFLKGRHALAKRPGYGSGMMSAGVIGGTLLGITAKENAALLPLLALVVEYSLFAEDKRRSASDQFRRWFYLLTVIVPGTLALAYLVMHPEFISTSYLHRTFSPVERMLTETRVLWLYISLILFPVTNRLGLFHDAIPVSTGLLAPPSTIVALAALIGTLYFIFLKKGKHPVLVFAMAWFLAGHLMESSVLGLNLVFEHRNYLPSMGILLAAAFGLVSLPDMLSREARRLVAPLILTVAITLGLTTWSRADSWKDFITLAESEVHHHPDSPQANDFAARVNLADGNLMSAIHYTVTGSALSPREAGFHVDLQILMAMLLHRIEPDLRRLPPDVWRAGVVQIENLPECVKAVREGNRIHLVCETSGSEIIAELLEHRPLSVHAGISLEELRRCLVGRENICQALERDVVRWFAIAAENPRTSPGLKERILFSAALVHAHRRDYQAALGYLDRASELAPARLSYRLGRVEYLLRMNRPADASVLLKQALGMHPPDSRETVLNEATINALRQAIIAHRPE